MDTYKARTPRLALLGNGPVSNRGCEGIVLGTNAILRREFGSIEILLASFGEDPPTRLPANVQPLELTYHRPRWSMPWWRYQVSKLLKLPEDKSQVLQSLAGRLDNVAAVLSVGGDGYAIDYGHFIIDRLVVMDNYARSLGIPVIIWGASIGPFDEEPEFERRMAEHLASVDLIVVREPISLEYLDSLGVIENVSLCPDPAFVVEPIPCSLPERTRRLIDDGAIGLNLSPLLAKFLGDGDIGLWIAKASSLLNSLLDRVERPFLLVPHKTTPETDVRTDDRVFLATVLREIPDEDRDRVAVIPPDLGFAQTKWIIGQVDAFIGARTHSTISALSSCVPCLSIAYSRKAWGINKMVFGHTDWVIPSSDLNTERFCERIDELIDEIPRVRSHLVHVIPDMIETAYASGELVKHCCSVPGRNE